MCSTRYYCQILMKLEFSRQTFEKYSNSNFHENPLKWESSCFMPAFGRTDTRKDMTKLIDGFCNFSKAPKKTQYFENSVFSQYSRKLKYKPTGMKISSNQGRKAAPSHRSAPELKEHKNQRSTQIRRKFRFETMLEILF